ncbi:MAG TPA: hypothetical protein VLA96_00165 [Terriglobales bacterium]|jgi:hypothetical protein|nr:hypothetical protein [Terriglobales bacterium]
MFARNVSVHLKPAMLNDYTKTFSAEVLPLLRRQKGFQDEISFCNPNSLDVTAISLWDTRENAELYAKNGYNDVVKILSKMVEGTPTVRSEEVIHSTLLSHTAPVKAIA